MGVRAWLNSNPNVVAMAAIIALLAALAVVALQFRGAARSGAPEVYYWDMQANETFVRQRVEVPPIQAPSGGEGVMAHLYTCGECTPDEWFGYLEKYTDEAKRHYEQTGELPTGNDHLVRALDGDRWVNHSSQEGQRIIDEIYAVYDDEAAAPCGVPGIPPRQCLP